MFFTNEKLEFRNRAYLLNRDPEIGLNARTLNAEDTLIQGQIKWVRELDDDLELLTDLDPVRRHLRNKKLTYNNS